MYKIYYTLHHINIDPTESIKKGLQEDDILMMKPKETSSISTFVKKSKKFLTQFHLKCEEYVVSKITLDQQHKNRKPKLLTQYKIEQKNVLQKKAFKILISTIIETPRNFKVYYNMILKKFNEFLKIINSKKEESSTPEFLEFLDEVFREDNHYIKNVMLNSLSENVTELAQAVKNLANNKDVYYLDRYLDDYNFSLNYSLENIRDKRSSFGGYLKDNESNLNWKIEDHDEYYKVDSWKNYKTYLYSLIILQEQIIDLITSEQEKTNEIIKMIDQKEKYRPNKEDIETMYHVSVFAKDIFKTGFKKDFHKENEGLGLGGATSNKGKSRISFTHDYGVAKELKRCLQEVIMIARKELKFKDVSDWANRENILEKIYQNTGKPLDGKNKIDNPAYVFDIYRGYLSLSDMRYNPVFFGDSEKLINNFKNLDTKDVGILVCKVNVNHPDVDYLSSMREYRVPVESVINIEKIM